MNQLTTIQNNQTLDSREVAEMVGKEHSNLMKDIRRYIAQSNEVKIDLVEFFQETSYQDGKGETRPCFEVTRKGCEFIANKLTGVKGTEFTAKYINRFHSMEETIQNGILDGLSTEMKALLMHDKKIQAIESKVNEVEKSLQDFKLDLPLLGVELDKVTSAVRRKGVELLGGKESPAYRHLSVRHKLYSDIYREIKRQFGVSSYKAIKRSQCDIAVEIVNTYMPPIVIRNEIDAINSQLFVG